MNPANHPGSSPVPWPISDDRVRAPDASILPAFHRFAPEASLARESAVVSRPAPPSTIAPASHWANAWLGSARTTLCANLVLAVAAGFVLGAWLARTVR